MGCFAVWGNWLHSPIFTIVAQLSVDKALLAAQCDEPHAKLQQYENDSELNDKT